jgi:hypothetical protein
MMSDNLARVDELWQRGDLEVVLSTLAELPRAAEPAVVLASLARRCVATCCDSCTISIDRDGYRLRWPPAGAELDGPVGIDPERLPLDRPAPAGYQLAERELRVSTPGGYAMTWTYRRHRPTDADLLLAQLALDRAVAILEVEQLLVRAEAADELAGNLQVALTSSREIGMAMGIVMERHKLSPDQAFQLLARISQQRQLRVREVAAQITQTGVVELPRAARPTPARPAGPAT